MRPFDIKVFCFFSSEKKALALLLLSTSLATGCTPGPLAYPPDLTGFASPAGAENDARIRGFSMPAPRPLRPATDTIWPAAPVSAPTMLEMMAQPKPAGTGHKAAGAAARGDFGLCLPTPAHLDANGRRSTAPPGVALGVC